MKRIHKQFLLLGLTIGVSIIGTILVYLACVSWYVLDAYEIPVEVKVSQPGTVGFNVNNTWLAFGKIPQGGYGKKDVVFSSDVSSKVRISLEGEFVESWVVPEQNQFSLAAGENRTIAFFAYIPPNASLGNYTGTAEIVYVRVFNRK